MVALLTTLTGFGLGAYLNNKLFVHPFVAWRASFNLQPELSDQVRLILLDDRSLDKIGRYPVFADWQRIASQLFDLGYERVLFQGLPLLAADTGELLPRSNRGFFGVGAAATQNLANSLAGAYADLPQRLTLAPPPSLAEGAVPPVNRKVLAPHSAIIDAVDGVGDITLEGGDTLLPFTGTTGHYLPSLPLLAASSLTILGDELVVDGMPLPLSADGRLHPDFVSFADVSSKSVPAAAFFGKDGKGASALSNNVSAKLAGGRIAILVPEAHTGQRFLETPLGLLPAYFTTVAIVNAVLTGRHLRMPAAFLWIELAALLLIALSMRVKRLRSFVTVYLTLAVMALVGGAASYQFLMWITPAIPVATLFLTVATVRTGHHYVRSVITRIGLENDLELGKTVQEMLLPQRLSGAVAGWDYHVVYRPYGRMSGDWVQIYEAPDAPEPFVLLAFGDVTGKGPSAALATAVISHAWRNLARQWANGTANCDLRQIATVLHEALMHTFSGSLMSTLSLALLSASSAQCTTFGTAPWLLLEDGKVERIRMRPRNLIGDGAFHFDSVTLEGFHQSDWLIAYTDGVMEGTGAVAALRSRMTKTMPEGAAGFAALDAVLRAIGVSSALPDDYTLVMARRTEPAKTALRPAR